MTTTEPLTKDQHETQRLQDLVDRCKRESLSSFREEMIAREQRRKESERKESEKAEEEQKTREQRRTEAKSRAEELRASLKRITDMSNGLVQLASIQEGKGEPVRYSFDVLGPVLGDSEKRKLKRELSRVDQDFKAFKKLSLLTLISKIEDKLYPLILSVTVRFRVQDGIRFVVEAKQTRRPLLVSLQDDLRRGKEFQSEDGVVELVADATGRILAGAEIGEFAEKPKPKSIPLLSKINRFWTSSVDFISISFR